MNQTRYQLTAFSQWFARVLVVYTLTAAETLQACPICDTETGQQVRAGIFDENFWGTLLAVLSPFPVLLLVIAAYHFGFPGLWSRSSPKGQFDSASTHKKHYES